MGYVVAIPSYRRSDTIRAHSLAALREGGVDLDRVFVFVADEAERSSYLRALPEFGERIRVGAPGIRGARNAIAASFPEGAEIVQMDDDVRRLVAKEDAKSVVEIADLDEFFRSGFRLLACERLSLWGVYPTPNPFYMGDGPRIGCRFCIGDVFGVLNRPDERLDLEEKEDYELTLRRFEADGGVLRFENVAAQSAPAYRHPGGLQGFDRAARSLDAVRYLVARWPGLVVPNPRRSGPYAQVLIRDPFDAVRRAARTSARSSAQARRGKANP